MSGVKHITVEAISSAAMEAAAVRQQELTRQIEEGRRHLAELGHGVEQARLQLAGLESQVEQTSAPLAGLTQELARLREESRELERRRAAMRRDTLSARDEAGSAVESAVDDLRRLEADLDRLREQQRLLQAQRAELAAALDSLHGPELVEARRCLQEAVARRDDQAASLQAFHARLQAWSSDPRHGAVVEALADAAGLAGFHPVRTMQDAEEIRFVFQDLADRTFHVALRLAAPEQELPSWVVTPGHFAAEGDCVESFQELLRNLAAQGVVATGRHGGVGSPGPFQSDEQVPLDQRVRE